MHRSGAPRIDAAAMTDTTLAPADFRDPAILLSGTIDYALYERFRQQLFQCGVGSAFLRHSAHARLEMDATIGCLDPTLQRVGRRFRRQPHE